MAAFCRVRVGLVMSVAVLVASAGVPATAMAPYEDGHHDAGHHGGAAPGRSEGAPAKEPTPATKEKAVPASRPAKPSPPHAADDDHAEAKEPMKAERMTGGPASAKTGPAAAPSAIAASEPSPALDADGALNLLREGNKRWVSGDTTSPNTSTQRREQMAAGQTPFVTVLTCADSRLPVERVFDRGVGDVFVVRVAGNVAGASETGTIEYGVEHLKTPLLVVMGHTKCGAVAAAASGAELHGDLGTLVSMVKPSVQRARKNNPEADEKALVAAAIRENVWQTVCELLKRSPGVRGAVKSGKVRVVGAVCDVATGKVEWMGEHPWQEELVDAFDARSQKATATAGVETEGRGEH